MAIFVDTKPFKNRQTGSFERLELIFGCVIHSECGNETLSFVPLGTNLTFCGSYYDEESLIYNFYNYNNCI